MEQEVYRRLPYDVEIEQALLGAILVDNYALERVSSTLKSEHFYDPLHGRIFEAIEHMAAKGQVITPLTLKAVMGEDPALVEVGGQAYLTSLAKAAPSIPSVAEYGRLLRDLGMRRDLILARAPVDRVGVEQAPQFALILIQHAAVLRTMC